MARIAPLLLLVLPGVVVGSSCANFDRDDRIEDLRILGVRAEPAEILYSPLHLLTPQSRGGVVLPTTDVSLEVFAFDPRGGVLSTRTRFCPPGATDTTCRLFDYEADFVSPEPANVQAELRDFVVERTGESAADTEASAAGRVGSLSTSFSFTPAVIDALISDSGQPPTPVPSIFSILPRIVWQLDHADAVEGVSRERGFKRVPVTLDLRDASLLPPASLQQLTTRLGFTLCEDPIDPATFVIGPADCLAARTPNENPPLRGFQVQFSGEEELPLGIVEDNGANLQLGLESLLEGAPGETIPLVPVFGPNASEPYQVVTFELEKSLLELENRTEDIACTWYSTRGDISGTLTAVELTEGLGTFWTLPVDAKPGERDTLVLVVLDQRGGTAVAQVNVVYP